MIWMLRPSQSLAAMNRHRVHVCVAAWQRVFRDDVIPSTGGRGSAPDLEARW
jgi:hypothetical protein